MERTTSIILTDHLEHFISTQISSGRYASVSAVIEAALHLLEAHQTKTDRLSKALEQGELSGMAESFDPQAHLQHLRNYPHKN